MVKLPSELYEKKALIINQKIDRSISYKQLLEKAGYQVTNVSLLADAYKVIEKSMPHIIVSEAILNDGSASSVYDRLQGHEIFGKIPIFVIVVNKTKTEMQALVGRKFAGFIIGELTDISVFKKMISQYTQGNETYLPYFLDLEGGSIPEEIMLSYPATIMGKIDDFVVSRSESMIDPSACVLCLPNNQGKDSVLFSKASNIANKDVGGYFNLFPMNKASGFGLEWLRKLREISPEDLVGKKQAPSEVLPEPKRLLMYDPNAERGEGFVKILKNYNIEVALQSSLVGAANLLASGPGRYSAVYIYELLSDASAIQWFKTFNSLLEQDRPALIIGTSSMNVRPIKGVHYLRRPFGLGPFLEILKTCFMRSDELSNSLHANKPTLVEVSATYKAMAELVSLDEVGGVLRLKFPIRRGSKTTIRHPVLNSIMNGEDQVTIMGSVNIKGTTDWLVRFQSLPLGESALIYYRRLLRTINDMGFEVRARNIQTQDPIGQTKSA